ncbi:MAG: hypothetical protein A3A96_02995 [Candidatus Zambryskibacteria bacterium RIFCSPLOWO2_01_FULL_39_39]|uniref:Uncharacterized protein n=1 Tax=Candidatus Zambryskibacteria bacterium RIFCSPLOWO2_01_FULL_39_39 TaxID=1802758 RepID=A0A1G2TYA9_9BACT|nr:MAG: hypothetical protein A3A96_02995 [Candidatus Zambryskibacteria bacterium RIFCSPLOWO2_01_FULL_39_39]
MSNLMLDVDQAGELKAAFRRGHWTNGQIKSLCEEDVLSRVRMVIEGTAEIVVKSVLSLVATVKVAIVGAKKTADCFIDKTRYCYRDADLDGWLPEDQSIQPESKFSVQRLNTPATFKQAVESFLGVTGDIPMLAKTLRERGCVTTLPTIETLIEQQEGGQDVDLRTNGYANFFFVEEKAENEGEEPSVSVVSADRGGGQWGVSVRRLAHDSEWDTEDRFFFRNKTL